MGKPQASYVEKRAMRHSPRNNRRATAQPCASRASLVRAQAPSGGRQREDRCWDT